MRLLALFLTLILLGTTNLAQLQAGLSAEAWREDLHFMIERMEARHPDLFWRVDEADFRARVSALDAAIPALTDDQIKLELAGLVTIADAHSHLSIYQSAVGFQVYPLQVYFFSDGLFVVDAANAVLIGAQVTDINGHSVEDVYNRVAPYVTHDNADGIRHLAPAFLVSPQVLVALGITDDVNVPQFGMRFPDGAQRVVDFAPVAPMDFWWAEWLMTHLPQRPQPLYLTRHIDTNFWFTLLEDSKTLYIQYNWIAASNADGESMRAFAGRLETFIEDNNFDRVVLDLRHNAGGNNMTYGPLLNLLQNERIDQPGCFYVLIGRRTFSAAMNLLTDLEQRTQARFVGEPTGETPNMYGDPSMFTLPNSGIEVAISSRFWNRSPGDTRDRVEPHLRVDLSSADYFAGRDVVLDAVIQESSALVER
jgi:hypothetical protein